MPTTMQDFVSKWKRITVREKQTYQEQIFNKMISSLDMFYKPESTN